MISQEYMKSEVGSHPYDCNPGYKAKINTFYYSNDSKVIIGYWEAPVGWFTAQIEEQNEINFVIEGEIDICSEENTITAKKGDCFLVLRGEFLKWIIKYSVRTIYFIYPSSKGLVDFFKDLGKSMN